MKDSITIVFIWMIVGLTLLGLFLINTILETNSEHEAQKIIDFRNENQTCTELKLLYLKSEKTKYNSSTDLNWYWEIEDKFVSNCIDANELYNLEFINDCKDGKSIGCKISIMENPELYENFDFKKSIEEKIKEFEDLK